MRSHFLALQSFLMGGLLIQASSIVDGVDGRAYQGSLGGVSSFGAYWTLF
ncbi:MAG: hypothetical protein L2C94_007270 [Aigarchaeota archaeon]|nr:hypothetical protein [Candidatus Wolframiiraptor gerlachensis]